MKEGNPERKQNKAIFKKIDLSKIDTWSSDSREIYKNHIIGYLKTLGLYKPNLLYRGFDVENVNDVKKTGTDIPDSEEIWCSGEDELLNDGNITGESATVYALEGGALSIYDMDMLENSDGMHGFVPREGLTFKDALVAVFKLQD
jgi:hypothetical protein